MQAGWGQDIGSRTPANHVDTERRNAAANGQYADIVQISRLLVSMRDGKRDRVKKQYGAMTEKVADYETIEGLGHQSGR
jgi:hypothetical protein